MSTFEKKSIIMQHLDEATDKDLDEMLQFLNKPLEKKVISYDLTSNMEQILVENQELLQRLA